MSQSRLTRSWSFGFPHGGVDGQAHPSLGLLGGDGRDHKDKTRAQQRAVGTKNTALFDIVNAATGNGHTRAAIAHA
jgi:hypothetical protein